MLTYLTHTLAFHILSLPFSLFDITASSPVGYEQYDDITVTRQIVVGGRNKYMVNGHTTQLAQVQNLFHSVQLNVNNPHL
jgi:structural maintenance of chromosome 2